MTSPWMTPAEAAEYARVSRATVYEAVESGRLAACRVTGRGAGGRSLRLKAADVDAWLESNRQPALTAVTRRRRRAS